jgi:hypothetical protein
MRPRFSPCTSVPPADHVSVLELLDQPKVLAKGRRGKICASAFAGIVMETEFERRNAPFSARHREVRSALDAGLHGPRSATRARRLLSLRADPVSSAVARYRASDGLTVGPDLLLGSPGTLL